MERCLRKLKNEVFPAAPLTVEGVNTAFEDEKIFQSFGMSNNDLPTRFFKTAFHDESFGYVVFSSDNIIDLIRTKIEPERRHYLIDATFKICPLGDFTQLLIIYVAYMDNVSVFSSKI